MEGQKVSNKELNNKLVKMLDHADAIQKSLNRRHALLLDIEHGISSLSSDEKHRVHHDMQVAERRELRMMQALKEGGSYQRMAEVVVNRHAEYKKVSQHKKNTDDKRDRTIAFLFAFDKLLREYFKIDYPEKVSGASPLVLPLGCPLHAAEYKAGITLDIPQRITVDELCGRLGIMTYEGISKARGRLKRKHPTVPIALPPPPLLDQVKELKADNNVKRRRIEELENTVNDLQEQNATLMNHNTSLEDKVAELQARLRELEQQQ